MKVYSRKVTLGEVAMIMFVSFMAGYLVAAVLVARW